MGISLAGGRDDINPPGRYLWRLYIHAYESLIASIVSSVTLQCTSQATRISNAQACLRSQGAAWVHETLSMLVPSEWILAHHNYVKSYKGCWYYEYLAARTVTCILRVTPYLYTKCIKIADLLLGWIGSRQSESRDYGRQAGQTFHSARSGSGGMDASLQCKCCCSAGDSLTNCPGLLKVGLVVSPQRRQ